MTDDDVRLACYAEIRDCMRTRLLDYYQKHKDRLGDERSQLAVKESMEGLDCIFAVLDTYQITRPQTDVAERKEHDGYS